MSKLIALRLLGFAFVIFVIGSYVIVAQNVITGDWKADSKDADSPDKIQLSFEIRTEKGGRNQHGSSFAYSDLQGLTRDQTQNGKVSFSLAREAGTIQCEGTFVNGKGSGTFRFTPNYSFADAMRSRGFDFAKSSKHGPADTSISADGQESVQKQKIQLITEEDAVFRLEVIPLYFPISYSLVKPYVQGFVVNSINPPLLKNVSIDSNWQLRSIRNES